MTGKVFVVSLLLAAVGVVACVQKQAAQPVKLTGYLVDYLCAKTPGLPEGLEQMAKDHTTECSLMPGCNVNGFALVSNKMVYKLDAAGDKSAFQVLRTTKTTSGLQVEVEGMLDGKMLHATKLAEVKAAE